MSKANWREQTQRKRAAKPGRTPAIVAATVLAMTIGGGIGQTVWGGFQVSKPLRGATGELGTTVLADQAIWLRSTYGYHSETKRNSRFTKSLAQRTADDVLNENPWGALTDEEAVLNPSDMPPTNPLDPQSPLVTMPGDSFEYCLPVITRLTGSNLAAGFKVLLTDPVVVQAIADQQLAVEFYLANPDPEFVATEGPCHNLTRLAPPERDAQNQPVPMARAGVDVVSLPALVASGTPTPFTVIVHVTVLGNYLWDDAGFGTTANTAYWDGETHSCATKLKLADGRLLPDDEAPAVACTRPKGKWSAEKVDVTLVQIRTEPTNEIG